MPGSRSETVAPEPLNRTVPVPQMALPFFGQMPLTGVQPTHARAFKADLLAHRLAPSTVKAILLTVGQIFAQAVDDGLIVRSPFAKVGMPEDREHEAQHFLTVEQVEQVADRIDGRYRAAVYLARSAACAPASFGRSIATG
jgi:hypothetical protein